MRFLVQLPQMLCDHKYIACLRAYVRIIINKQMLNFVFLPIAALNPLASLFSVLFSNRDKSLLQKGHSATELLSQTIKCTAGNIEEEKNSTQWYNCSAGSNLDVARSSHAFYSTTIAYGLYEFIFEARNTYCL